MLSVFLANYCIINYVIWKKTWCRDVDICMLARRMSSLINKSTVGLLQLIRPFPKSCCGFIHKPAIEIIPWELNSRITHARKVARHPPWLWNPGQTSSQVQNMGINSPTKGVMSSKNEARKSSCMNARVILPAVLLFCSVSERHPSPDWGYPSPVLGGMPVPRQDLDTALP